MPKKSNKTAHVLSLLTNGGGDLPLEEPSPSQETTKSTVAKEVEIDSNSTNKSTFTPKITSDILVEVQGDSNSGSLSDILKADLEKEFETQINTSTKKSHAPVDSTDLHEVSERPPYSQTFIDKFGLKDDDSIETTSSLNSEAYVLEKFVDEDDTQISSEESQETNSIIENIDINQEGKDMSTKVLHNLTEDVVKSKTPEIMKSLNMCCCENCMYDVIALTLNHTKTLYTVTEKGQLFQKLASYELQFGADIASQITKACITVKLNPQHQQK